MIRRRSLLLTTVLVLLTTGCFKLNLTVVVEDDGSGRIEGLSAIDAEAIAGAGALFGEDLGDAPSRDELCADAIENADVPAGATTELYEEGDFCGVTFSQEFTADELDATFDELSESDGDFVIRRDGDGWIFRASLSDEASADAAFLPDDLFDDAEFIVRVKLPGRQVEHNADRIESDGTMVWDLDPFNPGPDLMARTEPGTPITGDGGDDDGNTLLILVVVIVIAGLIALGVWFWWRKRSDSSPPSAGESAPVAPPTAPLAPPTTPLAPPTAPPPPPQN